MAYVSDNDMEDNYDAFEYVNDMDEKYEGDDYSAFVKEKVEKHREGHKGYATRSAPKWNKTFEVELNKVMDAQKTVLEKHRKNKEDEERDQVLRDVLAIYVDEISITDIIIKYENHMRFGELVNICENVPDIDLTNTHTVVLSASNLGHVMTPSFIGWCGFYKAMDLACNEDSKKVEADTVVDWAGQVTLDDIATDFEDVYNYARAMFP